MATPAPPLPTLDPPAPPPGPWGLGLFATLSGRSVAVAIGLAAVVAVALAPVFMVPFPVLLGRAVFVALVLLLAFTIAGQWPQRRLPRWLLQALAVAHAAPLATLAMYLLSTGGDLAAFVGNPARVQGFLWIAGTAMALGLVLALGALVRERDARARALQLQLELERAQLERQAADARLALLQAQIEPHFLFNTLANVQALVEGGSPRAAEVLRSLTAYLRAVVPRLHDAPPATLGDELGLLRAYLELMHLRMPDRLRWRIEVEPALAALDFPPLALLTLVENAVRHGIDPGEDGGEIVVGGGRCSDGSVRLWVEDSGIGLAAGAAEGTGIGNLRARLRARFGTAARLTLAPRAPRGVRAEMGWPAEAR